VRSDGVMIILDPALVKLSRLTAFEIDRGMGALKARWVTAQYRPGLVENAYWTVSPGRGNAIARPYPEFPLRLSRVYPQV
jgi:hypothetical protein